MSDHPATTALRQLESDAESRDYKRALRDWADAPRPEAMIHCMECQKDAPAATAVSVFGVFDDQGICSEKCAADRLRNMEIDARLREEYESLSPKVQESTYWVK